jgi:YesN/AraC family two-component response regulator
MLSFLSDLSEQSGSGPSLRAHSPLAESETPVTLEGKRVVIVEDEGITQMQLRHILSNAGLVVAGVAGNGKLGAEVVLRERPDLVLMDIRMPIMDGLEATRHILDVYPVCVVILTAFSDEEYWEEATGMGVCGYLLKPVRADTLLPKLVSMYQFYHEQEET